MKSHYYKTYLTTLLAAGILAAPAAFGNSVQFDFGSTATPSLTALFQDIGPNQIQLTINAIALNGNGALSALCFNFNPGSDATQLIFNQTGSVGGVQGTVKSANDSYKLGAGSGKFDIDFTFNPDFKNGDSVTYTITGIPTLSVNDFLYLETPSAGRAAAYSAGSIQEPEDVVIVQGEPRAVPDISSTFGLLAMASVVIGFLARRFKTVRSA